MQRFWTLFLPQRLSCSHSIAESPMPDTWVPHWHAFLLKTACEGRRTTSAHSPNILKLPLSQSVATIRLCYVSQVRNYPSGDDSIPCLTSTERHLSRAMWGNAWPDQLLLTGIRIFRSWDVTPIAYCKVQAVVDEEAARFLCVLWDAGTESRTFFSLHS